jgi:prepilin-type N-terminal cleavage/methylation domain-containing protein
MRISTTGTTSRDERGFTLIELCVVALLIAAIAAVAAPSFTSYWRASQTRNCAWKVAALASAARDYAITHASRAAVIYQDEQFQLAAPSDPADPSSEFAPLSLAVARPVSVPDTVDRIEVTVEGHTGDTDWPLVFFPDGQALAAQLVLEGGSSWTIEVTPLTGHVKVTAGETSG